MSTDMADFKVDVSLLSRFSALLLNETSITTPVALIVAISYRKDINNCYVPLKGFSIENRIR